MKRPKTKTILICVALFLFFVVIRFPFSNLKGFIFGKIYKNSGISVMADDLSLTLLGWPGVSMKNVEVILPPQMMGSEVDVSAQKMTARVGFTLFPPGLSYSVALDGLKKGGDLYVKLSNAKFGPQGLTSADIYYDAEKVDLGQVPVGGQFYTGKATGSGNLSYDANDLSKTAGAITLNVDKLVIPPADLGGIAVPQMNLGDVKAKIASKAGVVELQTFSFGGTGSDIQGNFGGEVKLGKNIYQSSLNITMKISFSDAFGSSTDTANQTFITILNNYDKRNPGKSYNLRWSKSIMQIATNFFDNPPEAIP